MKAIYIAREPERHARLGRRAIADVMSKPVLSVRLGSLLDEALKQMIKSGVRHLAVVDEQGRCTGIISDRAIASAWATDYNALAHRSVASVLDHAPCVLNAKSAVVDAARLMHDARTDAVVIVDEQARPLGMVTGSDLVSLLAK